MREYGFNENIQGYKTLLEIFSILDDKIQIEGNALVLPDNYLDYIGDMGNKLSKKFYNYRNKVFNVMYTETEFKQKQEKERKRKEEEQKRIEQAREKINKLKEQYGGTWKDEAWIKENIGTYYNFELEFEYFWTLIGDSYETDWKGNVYIPSSIATQIKNSGGSSFLGRSFKNKAGYSAYIKIKKAPPAERYGVYGIYVENELIYVGSTMREFEVRFKEHLENIQKRSNELYVYSLLEDCEQVKFVILIDIADLKTNSKITRRDVEDMELALIHVHKPKGNWAGVKSEFKYREA